MGYSVHVMRNEIFRNVSASGDTGKVTISELHPFTEYNISVAAVNSIGTGVYSNDITATTERK